MSNIMPDNLVKQSAFTTHSLHKVSTSRRDRRNCFSVSWCIQISFQVSLTIKKPFTQRVVWFCSVWAEDYLPVLHRDFQLIWEKIFPNIPSSKKAKNTIFSWYNIFCHDTSNLFFKQMWFRPIWESFCHLRN